jgi:hypothetical protein
LIRLSGPPLMAAPFTGGLPPVDYAISRFHIRWYPVTMLFLAFDLEMIYDVVATLGSGVSRSWPWPKARTPPPGDLSWDDVIKAIGCRGGGPVRILVRATPIAINS